MIEVGGDLDDVIAVHRAELLAKTKAKDITTGSGGDAVEINGRKLKVKIERA